MRLRSLASTAAVISAALTAAATLLGFAGAWWWVLDLCANFRVQYAVAFALCGAALAALRCWRIAASCAAGLAINLAVIAPIWLSSPARADPSATPVKVVSFNVNYHNERYQDVAAYLRAAAPDVAVLLEVTPEWLAALEHSLPDYEVVAEPQRFAFGVAAFIRTGAGRGRVIDLGGVPALELQLDDMSILGIHTMPPVSSETSHLRDALLRAAGDWANRANRAAAIVGDFNATPWSHAFRDLLDRADFVNSQRGIEATWPRDLWPLSIPIDHCVHTRRLTVTHRALGPHLGSDHRPLEVTLVRTE